MNKITDIPGQLSLFEFMPEIIPQPPWVECFKMCKHFDSHQEWMPDFFPGQQGVKRCRYCDKGYGTSGKQFWLEGGHMYCKNWEPKAVSQ